MKKRYAAILSGQGDIQYNIMVKKHWDHTEQMSNNECNDYFLEMSDQETVDKFGEEDEVTIIDFCSYNGKEFFQHIKENNIEIVDVFQGYIY